MATPPPTSSTSPAKPVTYRAAVGDCPKSPCTSTTGRYAKTPGSRCSKGVRRTPHQTLGPRRFDESEQPGDVVPPPSSVGAPLRLGRPHHQRTPRIPPTHLARPHPHPTPQHPAPVAIPRRLCGTAHHRQEQHTGGEERTG